MAPGSISRQPSRRVSGAKDGISWGSGGIRFRIIQSEVKAATFLAELGGADDELRDNGEITQFEKIVGDAEVTVVVGDFLLEELNTMESSLQSLVGPDDADIIPHEPSDFVPVVGDDDFFVRIGDLGFIPFGKVRRNRSFFEMRENPFAGPLGKDQAFEK